MNPTPIQTLGYLQRRVPSQFRLNPLSRQSVSLNIPNPTPFGTGGSGSVTVIMCHFRRLHLPHPPRRASTAIRRPPSPFCPSFPFCGKAPKGFAKINMPFAHAAFSGDFLMGRGTDAVILLLFLWLACYRIGNSVLMEGTVSPLFRTYSNLGALLGA